MNNTTTVTFHTFEELENHLKNCIHWNSTDNVEQYDVVGITTLLNALLENLQKNTNKHDSKDLRTILSNESLNFLELLSKSK